jgi:hypothetical protein
MIALNYQPQTTCKAPTYTADFYSTALSPTRYHASLNAELAQSVRHSTPRVIILRRAPAKGSSGQARIRTPLRATLLGVRRIDAWPRARSVHRRVPDKGPRRNRSHELSRHIGQNSDSDVRSEPSRPRTARKRTLNKLGGDNSQGSDSEAAVRLPKRLRIKFENTHEKCKDAIDEQASRAKTNAFQQLRQERGRWLFNQDRQNLGTLDEADRQAQRSLSQFHKDMMHTRPGEHLYLCLMSVPREIREMIYAAMFEDLPATMVVRPKASTAYRSSDLPRVVQPIYYVNRQLFAESVPEFLRTRDIHLDRSGLRTFSNFLGRISNKNAFLAVKSLTFGADATWSSGRNDYDGEEEAYSGSIRDGIPLVARCTFGI